MSRTVGQARAVTARAVGPTAATRSALVAGVATVVLLWGIVVGLLTATADHERRPVAAPPQTATEPVVAVSEPTPTIERRGAPAAAPSSPAPIDQMRLQVRALGIDAPVVPVPLQAGGVLDPPAEVSTVGWWDGSAEPGGGSGQTVLTGHTVHDGGGAMDDLEELATGDVVRVTDTDGAADYQVTGVQVWTKAELAQNAVEAFGQDRHHGRLVLVTCEDWNGRDFASNVVVFAEPLQGT